MPVDVIFPPHRRPARAAAWRILHIKRGLCVAIRLRQGNARASTSGTSSEYRLSRIFYLRPESGESIGQKNANDESKIFIVYCTDFIGGFKWL